MSDQPAREAKSNALRPASGTASSARSSSSETTAIVTRPTILYASMALLGLQPGVSAATPQSTRTVAGVAVDEITPPWPTYENSHDVLVSNHYRKLEVKALAISNHGVPVVV